MQWGYHFLLSPVNSAMTRKLFSVLLHYWPVVTKQCYSGCKKNFLVLVIFKISVKIKIVTRQLNIISVIYVNENGLTKKCKQEMP